MGRIDIGEMMIIPNQFIDLMQFQSKYHNILYINRISHPEINIEPEKTPVNQSNSEQKE